MITVRFEPGSIKNEGMDKELLSSRLIHYTMTPYNYIN